MIALAPAAAQAAPPATGHPAPSSDAVQAGIGGRGFGRSSRPGLGSSRRPALGGSRRPAARRPLRRRPLFGRGFFGSVLRALGIAYFVHLLFGWGAGGGSPLGLLIVLGLILWLTTRRRRRRALYY